MIPEINNKRVVEEDPVYPELKKQKQESGSKAPAVSKPVFTINSEVRDFSTISEKTHKVDSEKLNDLLNRISKIRKDLVEEEQKDLLLQLTHAENTLNRILSSEKKTLVSVTFPFGTSDEEFAFNADLVRHLKTLEDLRNDVGSGPIPLPETITPEIFKAIIHLLTILPSDFLEKPEGRSDLLDVTLSKTSKAVPFPMNIDNWFGIFQAANFLDCPAVTLLCTDFAERNVGLYCFDLEDSKKPEWTDFVKRLPEKFLSKLASDFLHSPDDYKVRFSLFGPFVKKLDLTSKNISQDKLNKVLEMCPHVEELNLGSCKNITGIPAGCTKLKKLNVMDPHFTQAALNNFATTYPALEELNLPFSSKITEIPAGFTRLKKLNVERATSFTQEALNTLAARCPALEELNLPISTEITEIPAGCTKLKKLKVWAINFTQAALNNLAARCPNIEDLNLGVCGNVTEIPAGFNCLNKLYIISSGFTQAALNDLAARCPNLKKFYFQSEVALEIPTNLRDKVEVHLI